MHPVEIQSALMGMVCLVDTREQDTPNLRARLRQMDCPHRRAKLDFGDYSAEFVVNGKTVFSLEGKVAVERKMSLDELARCFCQERERFTREFERAKAAGARIYLVVENGSFERIYRKQYRSKMSSQAMAASLFAFLARYDCLLLFCEPRSTGHVIRDVLYREAKERMSKNGDE